MKTHLLAALLAVLASTACQPPTQETAGLSEEDVATLMADTQEVVETMLAGDWDNLGKFYTEDAVIMLPNRPALVGRQAILQEYARTQWNEVQVTPLEIDGNGDLAYIRGSISVEMMIEGLPKAISDTGKYVSIFRRQPDGSWPAVIDIINSDLPLAAPGPKSESDQKTLYQRLGGYDVVAAILDNLISREIHDPELSKLFPEVDEETAKKGRQLALNMWCELTGGPCFYIGRDMKTIHQGLGITEEHWQAYLVHLEETLDELNIGSEEKTEFIAVLAGFKGYIVEQPE